MLIVNSSSKIELGSDKGGVENEKILIQGKVESSLTGESGIQKNQVLLSVADKNKEMLENSWRIYYPTESSLPHQVGNYGAHKGNTVSLVPNGKILEIPGLISSFVEHIYSKDGLAVQYNPNNEIPGMSGLHPSTICNLIGSGDTIDVISINYHKESKPRLAIAMDNLCITINYLGIVVPKIVDLSPSGYSPKFKINHLATTYQQCPSRPLVICINNDVWVQFERADILNELKRIGITGNRTVYTYIQSSGEHEHLNGLYFEQISKNDYESVERCTLNNPAIFHKLRLLKILDRKKK